MSDQFKTEPVFLDCTDPQNWAYMAVALQKAASLMDWTKKRDITDWRYVPMYRMLMGFSLENLIKGILIAEGCPPIVAGKLNPDLGNHGLRDLADQVRGITISDFEKQVLYELEPYVLWAGRYPAPKTEAGGVRIGHSNTLHDAELRLGVRLYEYLRQLNPLIDPLDLPLPPGDEVDEVGTI